ncbi:MAG: FKBP-type peptidyl-prolyl cis-trans isomerase [Promethearchaeota archaeon]
MAKNIVEDGDKVRVEYEGSFDDGEVFDSSARNGGQPLEFEVGAHEVIPGFEDAVLGKGLGEEFSIRLLPEEAYGSRDPGRVQDVPRSEFPPGKTPEPGMMVQIQHRHGDHIHELVATITNVTDEHVTLDLNHPMVGKVLNFKMKVVGID